MRNVEEMIHRHFNRWNHITHKLKYTPGSPKDAEKSEEQPEPGKVHPVICLSRTLGAGARDIAQDLCNRLHYEVFGRSIIDEIARDLKVQRELVNSLDEVGRSRVEILLQTYLNGREIEREEYHCSLVRVIQSVAMKGGLVLLGRGAGFILKDQAAINVFVTGPLDQRIERLMCYETIDEAQARAQIEKTDRQRALFIQKTFERNIQDPENYDLCINTGRIAPEAAAELVLHTLVSRGFDLEQMTVPVESKTEGLAAGK